MPRYGSATTRCLAATAGSVAYVALATTKIAMETIDLEERPKGRSETQEAGFIEGLVAPPCVVATTQKTGQTNET